MLAGDTGYWTQERCQLTRCTGDRTQLYIFYYLMSTVFVLAENYFRIKSNRIILPLIFFSYCPLWLYIHRSPSMDFSNSLYNLAVFKGVAANSRYLTFSLWSCYYVARRNIRRCSRGLHYRRWTHTGYISDAGGQRNIGTN